MAQEANDLSGSAASQPRPATPASPSVDDIKARLKATRVELEQTLEELYARLRPGRLATETKHRLVHTATKTPAVPVAAGAAVLFLLIRQFVRRRRRSTGEY